MAIGEPYISLARELTSNLSSAGNEVVVLTSSPSSFSDPIISLECPDDGTPIWHRKRHAVRAGLERSSGVVFIDSDYRLIPGTSASPLSQASPDYSGFASSDNQCFIRNMWFDKKFLELASERFGIDWREVVWWGCSLFSVVDDGDGLGKRFLDFWDEFACWVRDSLGKEDLNSVKALPDCAAMAFAAKFAVGNKRRPVIPAPRDLFSSILSSFQHLQVGKFRSS